MEAATETVNPQALSLVSTARAKGSKTLLEWKIKGSLQAPFWDKRDATHVQKGSLGSKISGWFQAVTSLAPPRTLHFKTHLDWGLHAHLRQTNQEGTKQGDWPKERQRPRKLSTDKGFKLPQGTTLSPSSPCAFPHSLFFSINLLLYTLPSASSPESVLD